MAKLSEKLALFKTFWEGFKVSEQTGQTPYDSWLALRRLYVETNGRFNDIFHRWYTLDKPPVPVLQPLSASAFSGVTAQEVDRAVRSLHRDGYYVFPQRLDGGIIDSLTKFAMETPVVLQFDSSKRANEQEALPEGNDEHSGLYYMGHAVETDNVYFNPDQLIATNYRFQEQAVVSNSTVQDLMADPLVMTLAQQYLKSFAMYTLIGMWWTTPYGCDDPSSNLAQMYHFDMDRIKFVNFFIYLTDVGPEDGPHCYVKGSCSRKPRAILKDGRLPDHEVHPHFHPDDPVEFTGPRGTLIVEDARGFHKAKMPTKGNRLALEFELSSCVFGGPDYPHTSIALASDALTELATRYPKLLSRYEVIRPVGSRIRRRIPAGVP